MRNLLQLSDMYAQTETINSESHSHETLHIIKYDVNIQLLEREVWAIVLIFRNTSICSFYLVALENFSSARWN